MIGLKPLFKQCVLTAYMVLAVGSSCHAQELQTKVIVNHAQIQGTDASVFEQLQSQITGRHFTLRIMNVSLAT